MSVFFPLEILHPEIHYFWALFSRYVQVTEGGRYLKLPRVAKMCRNRSTDKHTSQRNIEIEIRFAPG